MAKDSMRIAERRPTAAGLSWARRRAFAGLVVERVWPPLLGLAGLVALFLILSWFGLFAALPMLARWAILALLLAGGAVVVWKLLRLKRPDAEEVDRRIEAASHLAHQPLQAQSDRPAGGDAFGAALWRAHQDRMAARLRDLSGGAPRTRTERLDPFALRAALALLLVTAFGYSYGSNGGRVSDVFAAPTAAPGVEGRVDAWVTPPAYTGRAPIFLTEAAAERAGTPIEVPAGSILSVRVSEGAGASLTYTPASGGEAATIAPGPPAEAVVPGDAEADAGATDEPTPAGPKDSAASAASAGEYEFSLVDSGSAALSTTFRTLGAWSFVVTPDTPPTVAYAGEPGETRGGGLELSYLVADDYGARKGRAEIEVKEAMAPGARPLVAVPEINLALPRRARDAEGKGRTVSELKDSPYAGARVAMTLVVADDAGQEGRSETKTFTLPERAFTKPLARAVIEQRRMLALDANAAPRVVEMLDAVTMRGEETIPNASDYLALRAARTRIAAADNDEALVSAVDFLWEIALGIEDGNLSLAEKRLRDARENLAEALENGASDAEIDRLMAELREAMQEYMQAMAEAMKNQPPMSQEQMQNAQEIRPSDLDKMMDRIEELAKSGAKEAAQQMLSQLQEMMENLQAMRPGQPQQGGEQDAMRQQMDQLGELLRQQQALKDQTYDLGRQQMQRQLNEGGEPQMGEDGQPQPGQDGQQPGPMSAEELQKQIDRLKQQQGQLRQDLEKLQEAMKGMGMQPGEGLGEAGEAMGEAESALGEGDDGNAVGQQSRAMEALRKGAQDMMQQMQEAMQQGQGQQPGQGQGQGQMGEGYGRGEQRSGRDPLGRPRSTQGADFGQDVQVPDEIDTQRARRILDAIRDRLGDTLSPQLEREYLERLLRTQ
ncbi:TIGR02302 family protein [Aureimonas glaciei]|uniref:TIGR02302 family protein n=1 Tax=Aureimonas glaciei TaxID=1776957 RepID=A0A916Y6E4_9HYPH|nr:TIGR02302 family protein [Aureimonas glaciei]GGD32492.1 TIGR02302 family protein [Aureimonas glaciei]